MRSRENISPPKTSSRKYILEKKRDVGGILAEIDPFHENAEGEKYLEIIGQGILPVNIQTFTKAFVDGVDSKELSKSFRYMCECFTLARNKISTLKNESSDHVMVGDIITGG